MEDLFYLPADAVEFVGDLGLEPTPELGLNAPEE
jgi:hypothetical protein